MSGRRIRAAVTALALGLWPATRVAATDMQFSDQTVSAQIDAVHAPTIWLYVSPVNVASMLGGGAVGDFNRDGFQDILVLMGGAVPDKLYINNGDGTFTDRAYEWGVDYAHMGVGTAVGDYNNDGWLDIYVTSLGPAVAPTAPGYHVLYRNNAGQSFTNVAADAGVATTSTVIADGFGAAFGDFDLDSDLDLMVVGWVGNSGCNRLFRNNGDGTFSDHTSDGGMNDLIGCRGFSPRMVDMNGDLYPEMLVAADFQTSRYMINNGDGTFTDATVESGTGLDGNGMGHAVADFDGNGWLDWYVTSIYSPWSYLPGVPGTGNMLYLQLEAHSFNEDSVAWSVNDGGWGWGTDAQDFNHDTFVDIAETNGWQQENGAFGPEWLTERCYLFQNNNNAGFSDVAEAAGVDHVGQGRGLATLDYDNDGDRDLLVFGFEEPLTLYRNEVAGPDTNWLTVVLRTTAAPHLAPDGFGSRVEISSGGTTQVRVIDGGSTYLMQSELSAHFGLGAAAAIDEVRVLWNDGTLTTLSNVAANQTIALQANPADLNGDGTVDASDLATLLGGWGACGGCSADLDGNGVVDATDLAQLLGGWGPMW